MQSTAPLHLICPAYMHWVRDQELVILVDTRSGMGSSLCGFAAAVWQWLPWNDSYAALVDFATDLLQVECGQAELEIDALLQDWLVQGWLLAESELAHG